MKFKKKQKLSPPSTPRKFIISCSYPCSHLPLRVRGCIVGGWPDVGRRAEYYLHVCCIFSQVFSVHTHFWSCAPPPYWPAPLFLLSLAIHPFHVCRPLCPFLKFFFFTYCQKHVNYLRGNWPLGVTLILSTSKANCLKVLAYHSRQ